MPATVIHTKPAKSISNEDAEAVLTEFIDSGSSSIPDGVSKQLQRMQRDLRGLPPMVQSTTEVSEEPTPQN